MQLARDTDVSDYLIAPNVGDPTLARDIVGADASGANVPLSVIEERPLTIYLNRQEIVTAMTIGDHPEYLALGFLKNQGMLSLEDEVTGVDFDAEVETVVVRTATETVHEE